MKIDVYHDHVCEALTQYLRSMALIPKDFEILAVWQNEDDGSFTAKVEKEKE